MKWHSVDSATAHTLITATNPPGGVYPLPIADLPQPLGRMPGVSSYYVTGYTSGQSLPQGLTVGGELLVTRADGALTKNYQFAFAVSSLAEVYCTGPFKGFGHHVSSGRQVSVESLFNQPPFSPRSVGQRDG